MDSAVGVLVERVTAPSAAEYDEVGEGASVTYPIIFLMGMIANTSVILTIVFGRKLSRTLVLIGNMATADLLMLFTGCYLRYYDRFDAIANTWSCKVFNAADIMFLQISSSSILVMAYERLLKVTDQSNLLREQQYKKQLVVCLFTWMFGCLVAMPAMVFSKLHDQVVACVPTWTPEFGKIYEHMLFLTTYCFPGILIAIIYSLIVYKTKSVLSLVSSSALYQNSVVRMLLALVALFWIFHLPFWLCYFRAMYASPSSYCSKFWMESAIVFTYVNATVNPFLYAIITTSNCSLTGNPCDFGFDEPNSQDIDENSDGNREDEDNEGQTANQWRSPQALHTSRKNSPIELNEKSRPNINTEEIHLGETAAHSTGCVKIVTLFEDVIHTYEV